MYKKYFFLLFVFVIKGLSFSIKGMGVESLKALCSEIKNEGEFRYRMLNTLSGDQKESLKWELYRQEPHFMGGILEKINADLILRGDSICSVAWHPTESKLALGGWHCHSVVYIINMHEYKIERLGDGGVAICDLKWICEGAGLESRSVFGLAREWKKNSEGKWERGKYGKWYSNEQKLRKYLDKIKELNKKNHDGSLHAIINKDFTKVSIYNVQETDEKRKPLFIISALRVTYLHEPQVCFRNTEIIKNIAWGPNNHLVILRERASRCFLDSDTIGMEQVCSNEINIYSQQGNEWHIIAKFPTLRNGKLLWSFDGNYLAFYDDHNIMLFPTRLFNMSLHQILFLYDHYKKNLAEKSNK